MTNITEIIRRPKRLINRGHTGKLAILQAMTLIVAINLCSQLSVQAGKLAEIDELLIIEGESMTLKGAWSVVDDAIAQGDKYIHYTGANL